MNKCQKCGTSWDAPVISCPNPLCDMALRACDAPEGNKSWVPQFEKLCNSVSDQRASAFVECLEVQDLRKFCDRSIKIENELSAALAQVEALKSAQVDAERYRRARRDNWMLDDYDESAIDAAVQQGPTED